MGGTWVAIAAMAPCLERFEITLRPGQKEAPSMVTPASRSPMCDVIRVLPIPVIHFMTMYNMDICHPCARKHGMVIFFFILKWAFTGQLALCNKENVVFLLLFFNKFPVFWGSFSIFEDSKRPSPNARIKMTMNDSSYIFFYSCVYTRR